MVPKTGLLMDGEQPAGGQWNFDHDNRAPPPGALGLPQPVRFAPDAITRDVLDLVARRFPDHFGDLEPFWFATTRSDARAAFDHFLRHGLRDFGRYQDAMLSGHRFLCHAVVSIYLNLGLLDPLEMCRAVEEEWRAGRVPLNSAEGFIRQIIGWREFVRGIYWHYMPDYAGQNALNNTRDLPAMYWHGNTRMHCMQEALRNTFSHAYAHHIQRLMVTGNFALLTGVEPRQICDWYLAVYADAYDWVELPNTLGMVMHADNGLLGSKPYCASGRYIDRQSDYCRHCHYDVKSAEQENSCPFNSLYWHFLDRHRAVFSRNPRMTMMYRSFERMTSEKQQAVLQRAEFCLAQLDQL